MPKGSSGAGEVHTAATDLRAALRRVEVALGARDHWDAAMMAALLNDRDRVASEAARLQAADVDLRAEETRLATADAQLRRRAGEIVRAAGGAGLWPALRREVPAAGDAWWWHLDELAAARRRRTLRRALAGLALAILLAGGIGWAAWRFGPGPEARAYTDAMQAGEVALSEGDAAAALAAYEEAARLRPEAAEAQAMLGVLYEAAGRDGEASAALERARAAGADQGAYLVLLARSEQRAGLNEQAWTAATEAIAAGGDSLAEAYLVRGGIAEALERDEAALADYDQAATLADAAGQTELYAMARTRYALLLQRGLGISGAGTTP